MGKNVDDLLILLVIISIVLLITYSIIAVTYNTGFAAVTLILLLTAIIVFIGMKVL